MTKGLLASVDNEMFARLTGAELEELQVDARTSTFESDTILFSQGGLATNLYLIATGLVSMRKELLVPGESPEFNSSVTLCGPGEMVGWSALVPPFRYTLTAIAIVPTAVLVVEGSALQAAMERAPHIGFKVMGALFEVISRRLRQIEVALVTQGAFAIEDKSDASLSS